ncbi:hypothetical protein B0J13DRAFT_393673, partial [Dactylonectria estremocensis]
TFFAECLESLYFPEMNVRKSQVSPPAVGTTSWIWAHPVYRSFCGENSGILWIRGKPGSGKSVLALAIEKHLLSEFGNNDDRRESVLLGDWFYHRRRGGGFIKNESLIRSILHNFLQQQPSLFDNFFRQHFRSMDPLLPAAWTHEILVDIFKRICQSTHRVLCVIDAVDEAESTDVIQLLTSVMNSERDLNTKFIILSRPNMDIERQVIDYPCIVVENENAEDVARIVEFGLKSLQSAMHSLNFHNSSTSKLSAKSQQLRRRNKLRQSRHGALANSAEREKKAIECIRQSLLSKAQGSILWVKLVLDRIIYEAEGNQCLTLQELQGFVDEVPKELSEYYKQIVQELTSGKLSGKVEEVRQMLMWICAAGEIGEVTLDALWEAMALLRDDFRSDSLEGVWNRQITIHSYDELWRKIYTACGPFIEIFNPGLSAEESRAYCYGSTSIIQLMHQSIRDFLCDPIAAGVLHFSINEAAELVKRHLSSYLRLSECDSERLIKLGPQDSSVIVEFLSEQRLLQLALKESIKKGLPLREWQRTCHFALKEPDDKCESILHGLLAQHSSLTQDLFHSISARQGLIDVGRLFYRACIDGLKTAVLNILCLEWAT